MPAGRPSSYTKAKALKVCKLLADGKSLAAICEMKGMPDGHTVRKWLGDNPEFLQWYARAREQQADSIFDEALKIADEATKADIRLARLRIDTRFKIASRLNPKKYGDKATLSIGSDPDNPLVAKQDFSSVTTEQLEALVASRHAKEDEGRRIN